MDYKKNQRVIETWYRQYSTILFNYCHQFVDYHSAQEVVQETFRIAWEAVQHTEIQYPKTWLINVAKNVLRNRSRQRERWKRFLAGLEIPEENRQSEDPVNVELEYGGLIDRQDLHLLKLLAVDGYTYPEAAQELGLTAEACRKRAKRAEKKLRDLLEQEIF